MQEAWPQLNYFKWFACSLKSSFPHAVHPLHLPVTAQARLNSQMDHLKLYIEDSVAVIKKGQNPRTSLSPLRDQTLNVTESVSIVHLRPLPPQMNNTYSNHPAQLGCLLFQTDESSRETWNHGRQPPSGPGAKNLPSLYSPLHVPQSPPLHWSLGVYSARDEGIFIILLVREFS